MSRKLTKHTDFRVLSIFLIALVLILFVNSCGVTSKSNFINKYEFDFEQGIAIKTNLGAYNFIQQLKDTNGRAISLMQGKVALIFGSRECGSCLNLDPSIPYLVSKYPSIMWIYVEKSDLEPISILKEIHKDNFHIIQGEESKELAKAFHSVYTPDMFFIYNSKVVYEKLGFMASDFDDIVSVFNAFSSNNFQYLYDNSRKLLLKEKEFPRLIARTYSGKTIVLPDDFIGKPTVIFIFHGTCPRCKELMTLIPNGFKKEKKINKIIIFTPFSTKLNNLSIKYAHKFHLTELYYELESPPASTFYGIDTVYSLMKNTANIVYVKDEMLKIQNSLGFVSSPVLFVLDKNGLLKGIYEPPSSESLTPQFFDDLTKYLLNLQ